MANDLQTWRKLVVRNIRALAPILYAAEYIEDATAGVGTFCVEPRSLRIYWSPEFAAKNSEQDNAFILAHEAGHVLCRHIERRAKMKEAEGPSFIPELFMIAEEMAVNHLVKSLSQWPVPALAVQCPDEYGKLRTEQIYAELKKKVKIVKCSCKCIRGGAGNGKEGKDSAGDMVREQAIKSSEEALNKQAQQQSIGSEIGELERIVIASKPYKEPASLKQLLRRYLIAQDNNCKHFDQSTLYKRRLSMDGLCLPNLSSSPIARKFVVSVDNSGSIGDSEFAEFKSILHSVAQQLGFQEIIVQHFTTEVVKTERYFDIRKLDRMDRQASGGTAIEDCDIKASLSGAQFHVILTDGYVDWLYRYSIPTVVLVTRETEMPRPAQNLLASLPLLP